MAARKPSKMESVSKTQRVYPVNKHDYEIKEVIGKGATATVYTAVCLPFDETVAVKIINLEQYGANIDEIRNEIAVMKQCSHVNVVTYHTSFVVGEELWLVMRLLNGGSALDIMRCLSPKGLDEIVIATVLKETLKALAYFHQNGQIHRDVKAGNILVDVDGTVQLADFGVSSWLVEGGERRDNRQTFVGTPCWMAPEVMEQVAGYNTKADIWSFGITAIELATGHAPYAAYPPMKVLMLTLQNPSPTLNLQGEHARYSRTFKKMIDACLAKDPTKRPTAEELLRHPFFAKAKGKEFLVTQLITQLPPLHQRISQKGVPGHTPGTSGRLKKVPVEGGEFTWEWEETDDAPMVHPQDLVFKLRLRDKDGQLKDIEFPFDRNQDTAPLIASELVDAQLVPACDGDAVSKAIEHLLQGGDVELRFPISFSGELATDPENLVGYAHLMRGT